VLYQIKNKNIIQFCRLLKKALLVKLLLKGSFGEAFVKRFFW
jgi:hypothetical protein